MRVLNELTPKLKVPKKNKHGVVTYTTHGHAERLVFSLKSFYHFLGYSLPTVVVGDGRLSPGDVKYIESHIQNVRVLRKSSNDKIVADLLKKYKYCFKYRFEKLGERFNIKLFDPFLLTGYAKTIYLDDDIIFLNKPKEILRWLSSERKYSLFASEGFVGSLPQEWSAVEKMFAFAAGRSLPQRFNSGFVCINKSDYKLARINRILRYTYLFGLERSWTPEQYSLGISIGESKNVDLKENYIHLTGKSDGHLKDPFGKVFLHFAFKSKPLYCKYALLILLKERFLYSKLETI